jgi:hypothetical protein
MPTLLLSPFFLVFFCSIRGFQEEKLPASPRQKKKKEKKGKKKEIHPHEGDYHL